MKVDERLRYLGEFAAISAVLRSLGSALAKILEQSSGLMSSFAARVNFDFWKRKSSLNPSRRTFFEVAAASASTKSGAVIGFPVDAEGFLIKLGSFILEQESTRKWKN